LNTFQDYCIIRPLPCLESLLLMPLPRLVFRHPHAGRHALLALLACLALNAIVLWAALQQPWLGLELRAGDSEHGVLADAVPYGPAHALGQDAQLLDLATFTGSSAIRVRADDLASTASHLGTVDDQQRFFARQTHLASLLQQPVLLSWKTRFGALAQTVVTPAQRPVSALPASWWWRQGLSSAAFLLAVGVWLVRPAAAPGRWFGMSGVMVLLSVSAATLYRTRDLAIDGESFRHLMVLSHTATTVFGCTLMAVLLLFPGALIRHRTLAAIIAPFVVWWALGLAGMAAGDSIVPRVPALPIMVVLLTAAALQFRASRNRPADRVAWRWMGSFVLLGAVWLAGALITGAFYGVQLRAGWVTAAVLVYAGVAAGLLRQYVAPPKRPTGTASV
jgi:lysylphosphatidylglycerol synthetase-like protein (DUF2156 family)